MRARTAAREGLGEIGLAVGQDVDGERAAAAGWRWSGDAGDGGAHGVDEGGENEEGQVHGWRANAR